MRYLSRSQLETWQRCPRKGFLQYGYNGIGVVPVYRNVPLTTGIAVHSGVAGLLQSNTSEQSIKIALAKYDKEVESRDLSEVLEHAQQFTKAEQRFLIEGLIYCYRVVELPRILERYDVLQSEQELEMQLTDDLIFVGTADAILQDKQSKGIYVYSLKTIKGVDSRSDANYDNDLQGLTETLITEHNLGKITAGVRFCFLIKGQRYQGYGGEIDVQHSPLTRAWKRIQPNGLVGYASSWRQPNGEGGYTTLGKVWQQINVWEEMTAREWVTLLLKNKVMPFESPVIHNQVHVPIEKLRDRHELEAVKTELVEQGKLIQIRTERGMDTKLVDKYAPKHRISCVYPTRCEYYKVCHEMGPDMFKNVQDEMDCGKLEYRISHHESEKEYNETIRTHS